MIRAIVLDALARALSSSGGIDAAQRHVRRSDPLLRGRALRRLLDAYEAVTLLASADDEEHLLRLVVLIVSGVEVDASLTRDDVSRRARRVLDATRRPRWWPSALLAAACVIGVVALVITLIDLEMATEPPAEPPAGIEDFSTASPLDDISVPWAAVLAMDLPGLTAAVSAGDTSTIDALRKKISQGVPWDVLGQDGVEALSTVIDQIIHAASATPRDDATMLGAIGRLNDALREPAHIFFDVDRLTGARSQAVVAAFGVDAVYRVKTHRATFEVLALRRLDALNWTRDVMGFTREGDPRPLVLLDQIDRVLIEVLLPALRRGEGVPMVSGASRAQPWVSAVERRAGELVRRDLISCECPAVDALGELIGRRDMIFDEIEARAQKKNMTLHRPSSYRLRRRDVESLRASEVTRLARIDRGLRRRAVEQAYAYMRELLVESVARHEAQHVLDMKSARPIPAAITALTGSTLGDAGLPGQAGDELSAYLSELARGRALQGVNLVLLSRFALEPRFEGTAEYFAAAVVLEMLAEALNVTQPERGIAGYAAHFLAISAMPVDDIQAVARRVWRQNFGARLEEMSIERAR